MADAARPAHLACPTGALLVTVVALELIVTPLRVHAAPATATATATAPAPAPAPASGATEGDATAEPAPASEPEAAAEASPDEGDQADPEGEGAAEAGPEETEGEAEATEATDPEATEASGDAEATTDAAAAPGALGPTAAPLRPMQTAAWWTMFGAFAVGTTAGVLAGLAERQEDRATRLSTLFDVETGAQPLYADRQSEYEQYLRRGEGYARAAIGVGVLAGAATIAAITLFAIDARRQRSEAAPTKDERKRAAWRLRGGGMEVRF